jgi:hypothetical protein
METNINININIETNINISIETNININIETNLNINIEKNINISSRCKTLFIILFTEKNSYLFLKFSG